MCWKDETGPGYEKCLDSPSGDYFHPIYQGPKIDDQYIPWVPAAPSPPPPPVSISPALPAPAPVAAPCPAGSYVDPNNLSNCLPSTDGNDYVALAASPGSTAAGGYGTATTQEQADSIAMAQCVASGGGACLVASRAYHACAAFALDPNGAVIGGTGPDMATAATDAQNKARGAYSARGHCADPPGN